MQEYYLINPSIGPVSFSLQIINKCVDIIINRARRERGTDMKIWFWFSGPIYDHGSRSLDSLAQPNSGQRDNSLDSKMGMENAYCWGSEVEYLVLRFAQYWVQFLWRDLLPASGNLMDFSLFLMACIGSDFRSSQSRLQWIHEYKGQVL
jgi:hypothetical protein